MESQAAISQGVVDVVVAGEDPLVLRGLRSIFDQSERIRIVAECTDEASILGTLTRFCPDVLLMTTSFLREHGLAKIAGAHGVGLRVRVVLTGAADHATLLSAIENGAFGFISSKASVEEFESGLEQSVYSECPVMPDVASQLLFYALSRPEAGERQNPRNLTMREHEVLNFMTQGFSNKEIGAQLHISLGTVKAHVSNVLRKLEAADRTQAVVRALKEGLVGETQLFRR